MKKKALISIVLLALIGTSAVFAQQPTLDKLKFFNNTDKICEVSAANQQISGTVVIPATASGGRSVERVSGFRNIAGITSVVFPDSIKIIFGTAFQNCTGLTSITIPANVHIDADAFTGCTNLTSVTFQGRTDFQNSVIFPGDLKEKYQAGGPGTYTRQAGSNTWTKQGGFTLSGVWTRSDGMQITITENGQNITITGDKPNNGGRLNDTYAKR